jgi:glycogen debranching enzyme
MRVEQVTHRRTGRAGATIKRSGERALPSYHVPADSLHMGASLGNACAWITTRANGDIERLFSIETGVDVLGGMALRYAAPAEGSGEPGAVRRLDPVRPGRFELHPAYQCHSIELPGGIVAHETVFLPKTAGPERAATYDGCVVYQLVDVENLAPARQRLAIYALAHLRGQTPPDIESRYDARVRAGALLARNRSRPRWVRMLGVVGAECCPASFAITADDTRGYAVAPLAPLANATAPAGDVISTLQAEVALEPGERRRVGFVAVFSAAGEAEARRLFAHAWDAESALTDTIAYYTEAVATSEVMTPDPVISDGVVWAKANMLRVMADYPTGRGFTNDPGRSSNVVARDAAWFVSGADYLVPRFSRTLLNAFAARQQLSGKIIEYYDAVTDHREDYGLNINDNTPLFVAAVDHHHRVTCDDAWLARVYPNVARATRYILSQLDVNLPPGTTPFKLGLIFCTARGEGVAGIAGWRNILARRNISGAVTEINAECYGALRAAARLARVTGEWADADAFRQAAEALREAINAHLLNPSTGMYYLTIDPDGRPHPDVTADELFPVMFDVAPESVALNIVSRLHAPDFWTDAGIRTVSRLALDYSPDQRFGLTGGVWPGVTWWLAIAAGFFYPELMVRALRASFDHFARDPVATHTVPGQFAEWFDGESLINRGARLSPWEPPRFLWAAVEGICGLTPLGNGLRARPLLPADWQWLALRRFPFHEGEHALFITRQPGESLRFYSTVPLEVAPGDEVIPFDEDVTTAVALDQPAGRHVALRKQDAVLLAIGSASAEPITVTATLEGLLDPALEYVVARHDSNGAAWEFSARQPAADLTTLTSRIAPHGCQVYALQPAG